MCLHSQHMISGSRRNCVSSRQKLPIEACSAAYSRRCVPYPHRYSVKRTLLSMARESAGHQSQGWQTCVDLHLCVKGKALGIHSYLLGKWSAMSAIRAHMSYVYMCYNVHVSCMYRRYNIHITRAYVIRVTHVHVSYVHTCYIHTRAMHVHVSCVHTCHTRTCYICICAICVY